MDPTRHWFLRTASRIERRKWNRAAWFCDHLPAKPRTPRRDRPRCGAMTRKGTPCRAAAVWDDN
ncbi:MAG: hypothetical protein KKI08_25695, partial [Armatimonadetes bacterium]|nr:hypothetical protein [Armatimonadota bacterium]